jgi:predicted nucleic acid-binding protein
MTRYYLDTSAWVDLLRSEAGLNVVLEAWHSARFEMSFTQENMNELLVNETISDETRERDLPRLAPLIEAVKPDEIAIVGHGKLGMMKLSSTEGSLVFTRHISFSKNNDRNTTADGIHLVNAISLGATLVTRDGELIASAKREGLPCLKLREFLKTEDLQCITRPKSLEPKGYKFQASGAETS